ncbi:MAG: 2-oxoacid:acceptor oxidoreductase family protein [Aggregatilineales bacterium]
MQHELIFAGFGGQGIMFGGQLLAYAAMDCGYHVTWIPSYGPEMRGGTAYCTVVIADQDIGSPVVKHPGIGMIFNAPSFDKFVPMLQPNGLLIYNASLIPQGTSRQDLMILPLPAAERAPTPQLTNMVMLGALLTAKPILTLEALKAALETHMPAHCRSLLEPNLEALAIGAQLAEQALERL